jgi:trans-aconitate 2-methyltransferase
VSWSPETYLAFEAERSRPARDLVNAIPEPGYCAAIDLGCGPGNSTEILKKRFPEATVEGLDSSAEMLAAAETRLPDVRFTCADIERWDGQGPYCVILANATLQWLPDHAALLPRLAAKLSPGGSLAVQMPDNLDEPAHRLMREVAGAGPWARKLAAATPARGRLESAEWYYRLLKPHVARVDVWRTVYHHALPGGAPAIIEWFKGSGLRPFLAPLDPAEQRAYLAAYLARLAPLYPPAADGTVLLPFPRLFFVAAR